MEAFRGPLPDDAANRTLIDHVHPGDWVNPSPAGTYDLVVIGGGTAGLVSAMGAAGLGARVALIERHLLGGDCLNTGCVPSKALIRSARAAGELRRAGSLGLGAHAPEVDFARVMQRMRERRATIAKHDAASRLRDAGVDVFFGDAHFSDDRTIDVAGASLRFNRAVIATGGRPTSPPVPGLDGVAHFTSDTVFSLTERPRRLLVLGAGPIGCELGQAFARLGVEVTMVDQATDVLPRESPEAAAIVRRNLEADDVRFALGVRLEEVRQTGDGIVAAFAPAPGVTDGTPAGQVTVDAILVAAGRAPNIEGLGLEAAGVAFTKQGVTVDDRLRTTNRRIYASGDVASSYKFTHAADALSRIVIQNALFFGRRKASALVIPWVTYTDPEVAHVGVSHTDVAESNERLATITVPLSSVDRSIVDDEDDGFIAVHHEGGRVRGCTIVAPHAGEMIGEAVFLVTHGGTLGELSSTVHPYPTVAEALRKAGDTYRREALTPSRRRWLERYFAWTR